MNEQTKRVPKIRFPGFADDWEQRKLGEVIKVETRKNGKTFTKNEVLSVSDEYGCVNQIRFQGRSFAGEDISNYKIVNTGDIIYTRSPLQAKPYGIIKIVRDEIGIVSPLYIVNKAIDGNDAEFVYRVFDLPYKTNKYLSPLVRKGAKNTMNISEDEWLSGDIVVSPNYEEQKAIGGFFKQLDNLITLHQRKHDSIKQFKQGMLQKMFPKEGEKVPEIRFPGFTDDWEQRMLSDCAGFRRGSFPQPYGNKEWYDGEGAMPFVQVADVADNMKLVDDTKQKISKVAQPMSVFADKDSVLVTLQGSIGRVAITQYGAFIDRTVLIFDKYNLAIDKTFWAYIIKEKFIDEARKAPGGTIKTITKEALSDFDLMLPSYDEQVKIGGFFEMLDEAITLHQRKIDSIKLYKQGLLQQMFV